MLSSDKTHIRKKRHHITQEDFTPLCVVEDMVSSLFGGATINPFESVLDNSCGIGNLLVAVLKQKLQLCNDLESSKRALKSVFGVELMADNVEECRQRLYDVFVEFNPDVQSNPIEIFKIKSILRNRIQWHDSLLFDYEHWPKLNGRTPDKKHMNVSFKEPRPKWNTTYPMWTPKPKPQVSTQLSLWDD